jgi:nitroreductase
MDLMSILLKRRSIRNYTDQDIPEESLKRILEAGLLAPSSRNLKPCEFYVIKDKDLLVRLSRTKSAEAKV